MSITNIEPTGVLFVGVCDIQTEKCTARTAAPLTAVWSMPAREQINVCRSCLDEMVRRGEWHVAGARLRRSADVAVFDHAGNLQVVIEVKRTRPGEDTVIRAIQIRRNLLAHAGLPQTPFFLIAFPDHFYVWRNTIPDTYDRPPDYQVDAQAMLETYAKSHTINTEKLSEEEFAHFIADWLTDLQREKDESQISEWIKTSGLYQAIKDGSVAQEVTIHSGM